MVSLIFSVFDMAARAYLHPFCAKNEAVAKRYFIEGIADGGPVSKSPDDYILFSVGIFNDADGSVQATELVRVISGREAWLVVNGE